MRQKLAIKSSIIGIISQGMSIVLSFICTRFFLKYIGLEAQGINGVVANVLGFLQLSELGIGTAITYALYDPVVKKDEEEICIIMKLYKKAYWVIGSVIFLVGLLLSFGLDYFVVSTVFSKQYVQMAYLILLISTASTYFLAYKRNLLYADQKQYIITSVDMFFSVLCSALKILLIVVFDSYLIYLLVTIIQAVGSNVVISLICNRLYPFIKNQVNRKYEKIEELKKNVFNLIVGKIGGFVYSSTDNLIVSWFSGIAAVGLLTNYKTLTMVLNNLSNSITAPVQPMIGNYIREYKDTEKSFGLFKAYTFIRFYMASVITVGIITMSDSLITLWLGADYILPRYIVILLALDIYLGMIQGPSGEFMSVLGYFQYDKYLSLAGAAINLVVSIIMSRYYGIAGVLVGTVITQIFYLSSRAFIVFKNYFRNWEIYYAFMLLKYTVTIGCQVMLVMFIQNKIFLNRISIPLFIIEGVLCVMICIVTNTILYYKSPEHTFFLNILSKIVPNRFKKGNKT